MVRSGDTTRLGIGSCPSVLWQDLQLICVSRETLQEGFFSSEGLFLCVFPRPLSVNQVGGTERVPLTFGGMRVQFSTASL